MRIQVCNIRVKEIGKRLDDCSDQGSGLGRYDKIDRFGGVFCLRGVAGQTNVKRNEIG